MNEWAAVNTPYCRALYLVRLAFILHLYFIMAQSAEFSKLSWDAVHVPEACRNTDIVVGIDEAGRGPVLGSLVYCAAFWPAAMDDEISRLGFDDSKVLSESDREGLFEKIRAHGSIGWVIEELCATKLSEDMLRVNPVSLNKISYDSVVQALETIRDLKPTAPVVGHVYVDTVGDPDYYKSVLVKALGSDFSTFTIEKKADAKYKVVSAASIIAKVTRDSLLRKWEHSTGAPRPANQGPDASRSAELKRKLSAVVEADEADEDGVDMTSCTDLVFGSGYPGDPKCVEWLGRNIHPIFGFPDLVRFSWSTTRVFLAANNAAVVEWACDQEERAGADIVSMFSAKEISKRKIRRSQYRASRSMEHMTKADFFASG